uniref:Capsid protein n=1 Tax=Rodent Torque teno virus 1 TaxID=1514664 RepID=X2G9U7_9VIRU|nr:ORF1 [Rodent Torque teno virus 1]AHN14869.1 ORF1 [Rodent Torque teno virus 1]
MAWRFPRRTTWKRKTWRQPRRRTYRRRAYRRTRRTRKWRRGRRNLKVRVLTEIQPRYTRRCVIRGIMCPLIVGQPNADGSPSKQNWELRQGGIFAYKHDGSDLWMGTWSMGMVSLSILYGEHQAYRNRWSVSNCGFDMVEYRGTTIYLEQHSTMDYIVFFDEEYRDITSFAAQASLHPLVLMTHPKTILIKSRERAGPRRARKVFIPRPSWWDSGWKFSKDVCNKGLFVWYISAIDMEHPWMKAYVGNKTDFQNLMWWRNNKWKEDFDTYVRTTAQMLQTSKNDNNYKTETATGPFMLSIKDRNRATVNQQFTWFYKSYWHWGGNNLTIKKVCNPNMDVPIT